MFHSYSGHGLFQFVLKSNVCRAYANHLPARDAKTILFFFPPLRFTFWFLWFLWFFWFFWFLRLTWLSFSFALSLLSLDQYTHDEKKSKYLHIEYFHPY